MKKIFYIVLLGLVFSAGNQYGAFGQPTVKERNILAQKAKSNLITYCKVSEVSPGLLKFEGDGFALKMTYDARMVKPKIQFIEVNDPSLKRYWPDGVTQVVLEFIEPGLKGKSEMKFSL